MRERVRVGVPLLAYEERGDFDMVFRFLKHAGQLMPAAVVALAALVLVLANGASREHHGGRYEKRKAVKRTPLTLYQVSESAS